MKSVGEWRLLTTLSDVPSASVLARALETDKIDVRVVSDASVLGQAAPCRIYVNAAQLHRARWALSLRAFSEEELACLALENQT